MFGSCRSVQSFGFSLLMLVVVSGTKQAQASPGDIYNEKRDGIELRVKRLSGPESHRQFGRDLVDFGYQPIEITILNDSTDQLLIRASSIDLQHVSAKRVCEDTERSVLGLLSGPAYLAVFFAWPVLAPVIGVGVWLSGCNKSVKTKIREKFFGGDKVVELLPYEQLSRYVFVPTNTSTERFNLYLFKRQEKMYVPFTVKL